MSQSPENQRTVSINPQPNTEIALNRNAVDPSHYMRFGWLMVLAGFGGFMLWAALAPLDNGVVVEGKVTVNGFRKTVQIATDGVVADVLVNDGQSVEAGQPLLRLDLTTAKADYLAARSRFVMAIAESERLKAEKQGRSPEFSQAFQREGLSGEYLNSSSQLQQQVYTSQIDAQKTIEDELMLQQKNSGLRVKNLQELLQAQRKRKEWLLKRLDDLNGLHDKGYASRHNVLQMKDTIASVEAEIASAKVNLHTEKGNQQDIEARLLQVQTNYQKELHANLVAAQLREDAEREQFAAASFVLNHSELRAPVPGTVVNLQVFSHGTVLSAGAPVLDILPSNKKMQVQARVPIDRVDSLNKGQEVELLFTAFDRSRTPKLPGKVSMISADSLTDDSRQLAYYAMTIDIFADELKTAGLHIQPGMPVQAFVRSGELSLLTFLLKPLLDRFPGAWGE